MYFTVAHPTTLTVRPFLDTTPRGVFATRAPRRPNAIGLSIVRLIEVKGSTLFIEDVDILDGTPLLDLKPYVPVFDAYPDASSGWLEQQCAGAECSGRMSGSGDVLCRAQTGKSPTCEIALYLLFPSSTELQALKTSVIWKY